MSRTIKKINQLKNTESFIQAHTIKGFKYIDKAGEIINLYHLGNKMPKFTMNPDGLILENPIKKMETLKITPTFIWSRFLDIDNLGKVIEIYIQELKRVCSILEVEKFSRIGWRNYFIYEFLNKEQETTFLEKIKILDNTNTEFIRLNLKTNKNFESTLMIQVVAKDNNPGQKGVLFDIDIFNRAEIEINDVLLNLKSFKDYLKSTDNFLSIVNNILK